MTLLAPTCGTRQWQRPEVCASDSHWVWGLLFLTRASKVFSPLPFTRAPLHCFHQGWGPAEPLPLLLPFSGTQCCGQDNLANELVKGPLVTCPGLPSAHLGNSTERLKRLRARRRRLSLQEALTRRCGTPLHLTNYLMEQVAHSGRLSSIWAEELPAPGEDSSPPQGRGGHACRPGSPGGRKEAFRAAGCPRAPGPLWLHRLKPGWCSVSTGELTALGHLCH